jgi:hypothetical protein
MIAIYLTQEVIGAFSFGSGGNITFLLVLAALTIVNIFGPLVLRILSLPSYGLGFLFLIFVLNVSVLYVITIMLPSFSVGTAFVSELNIFGFVLPSKSLSRTGALVFSALLFVLILNFFNWLSPKK